jgi:hypothetical protein
MEIDFDASFQRIDEILGEADESEGAAVWLKYLRENLALPRDVTGKEDFQWEEPYVLGVADAAEYRRLCRRRPSYRDIFTLERIVPDAVDSEWSMHSEDLGAYVTRKSDGRPFLLGLSELKTVDHERSAQLLQDYGIWFVNYR